MLHGSRYRPLRSNCGYVITYDGRTRAYVCLTGQDEQQLMVTVFLKLATKLPHSRTTNIFWTPPLIVTNSTPLESSGETCNWDFPIANISYASNLTRVSRSQNTVRQFNQYKEHALDAVLYAMVPCLWSWNVSKQYRVSVCAPSHTHYRNKNWKEYWKGTMIGKTIAI